MLTTFGWAIVLRAGQVAVDASLTLLCGFFVAGIMRRMLGSDGTRRLFGGPGLKGLFRAWAVGTLLPVCSLGVLPIAREMRRAGVPSGTILAFVLAAPHINPLSLLYGLTLSEPLVIICFALGSLVVALAAGALWEYFLARPQDAVPPEDEPMPAPGLKRLGAVGLTAARESVSSSMGYVLLALLATALVAGMLPYGCLSRTMRHDNLLSPVLMTAIALPIYMGPLQGMMRLGLMFEHGNSVGAAFALFELGIGVNLGLIVWLGTLFGWRRVLLWVAFVAATTLALAYASERPLYFAHQEEDHTHAFDEWTSPFLPGMTVGAGTVRAKLLQRVQVLELVGLGGLALLVLLGLAARAFDREGRWESWLLREAPSASGPVTFWNRSVPGPVLGILFLLGLVGFSVVGLYLYYPAPKEAFEEITKVRANATSAVRTGDREEAIRQIQHWDLWTRKLQVGVFIRTGHLDKQTATATEDLRERLEDLRDALLADKPSEARSLLPRVEEAYRLCRRMYGPVADRAGTVK